MLSPSVIGALTLKQKERSVDTFTKSSGVTIFLNKYVISLNSLKNISRKKWREFFTVGHLWVLQAVKGYGDGKILSRFIKKFVYHCEEIIFVVVFVVFVVVFVCCICCICYCIFCCCIFYCICCICSI